MSEYMEIKDRIKELQAQADVMIADGKKVAIAEIKSKMSEYCITLAELGNVEFTDKLRTTVPIKYRGQNGETWTGRGLTPKWLAALLAQGKTKQEFAVA